MKKTKRDRNKDMERDKRSARRKKTVLRKKRHGFCRNRKAIVADDQANDRYAPSDRRHLVEALMVRQHMSGVDGAFDMVEDSLYYPDHKVRSGEGVYRLMPPRDEPSKDTTRRGRSTPWDGMAASMPWGVPGSPRTSACF